MVIEFHCSSSYKKKSKQVISYSKNVIWVYKLLALFMLQICLPVQHSNQLSYEGTGACQLRVHMFL